MKHSLAVLLVGCLGASACASALWQPVLSALGGGDDEILVSHKIHKENDVDCLGCHETLGDAKDLEVRQIPPESKCMECHEEWKMEEPTQCQKCHAKVERAQHWPDRVPDLHFNHQSHLERVKDDCSTCHKRLKEPRKPGLKPTMDTCTACHNHRDDYDEGRCDQCHQDLYGEKLRPVASFRHQGNYIKDHRLFARASSQECSLCHDQPFCGDCHQGNPAVKVELKQMQNVESQFIHRGDFVSRHALEARADPALCQKCHGTSTCTTCHEANNLTPRGDSSRNPHPAGFGAPWSRDFHGPQARMDISSCAACHEDGPNSNCIECHRVGGVGGNPHPASWNAMHSRSEISRNGMCLYCHN